MSVEDFYAFEQGGIVRSRVSKARVFFFSAKAWASIETELFNAFSTGATLLLNEIGRYYGLGLVKEAKLAVNDPPEILDNLQILAGISGWGDFSISGDPKSGKEITVSAKNCIFCAEQRAGWKSCHLLTGLVRGLVDELYSSAHSVSEVECIRNGATACRLLVRENKV